jgi:hypothetical protein
MITRRLLWRGTKDAYSGGHCLVAWPKMTLSREHGGLGIIDLELQNKELLLKWLWLAETNQESLWPTTLNSIECNLTHIQSNQLETKHGLSFFVNDLKSLLPLYHASVSHESNSNTLWCWYTTFTVKSTYQFYNNPRDTTTIPRAMIPQST